MPIRPGYWPGGKYQPKIYRGPAVQQVGGNTTRFDATKLQRDTKEVDADGNVKGFHTGKLRSSSPKTQPKEVDTVDMDADINTAEAQTVDEILDDTDSDSTITNDAIDTTTDHNANSTAYEGSGEETIVLGDIKDRNLNLGEGSQETSTTADYLYNYTMDVAAELGRTIASADIGEVSANERDEMSDIIDLQTTPVGSTHGHEDETQRFPDIGDKSANEDGETSDTNNLQTNPVESPHGHEVELQPFDLLRYPDSIIQQILRNLLVKDKPIKPFWNLGSVEVSEQVANKEDFTTDLIAFPAIAFASHSRLLDAATTVFYGENMFVLEHAKIALWWLKRIGSNMPKLKCLEIKVEGGEMDKGFGVLPETLWKKIFLMLYAKHQTHRLEELKVDFSKWTNDFTTDARKLRNGIIMTLLSFRGLRRARIEPGLYVSQWTAGVIRGALLMGPGQTSADVRAVEQHYQAR